MSNYGEKGRAEGLKFEDLVEQYYGFISTVDLKEKIYGIHGKKTTSKTDKIISGDRRVSIKNPKAKGTSIQIQVNPFSSFVCKFSDIPAWFELFFGCSENEKFIKMCQLHGIDYGSLSLEEKRRNRLDIFSIGLEKENELVDWFYTNRVAVAKMAFQEGFHLDSEILRKPEEIIWASKKNDLQSIKQIMIKDLLSVFNKITKNEICFRKKNGKGAKTHSGTVLQIGPLTLQMKGSGEGEAYHSMQFNASLTDIENYFNLYSSGVI